MPHEESYRSDDATYEDDLTSSCGRPLVPSRCRRRSRRVERTRHHEVICDQEVDADGVDVRLQLAQAVSLPVVGDELAILSTCSNALTVVVGTGQGVDVIQCAVEHEHRRRRPVQGRR